MGLDLGGTKLAAALFSAEGKILHRESVALAGRRGPEVGELVAALARRMTGHQPVRGMGICSPGIYYAQRGSVWAPNIPGWEEYPLLDELRRLFPETPVRIDSDRACYILGESWQGAARGCRDAIFLAIGTGIGAGILVDGRVLRGHGDIAGAVGWMALRQPFAAGYAACGCFEYHASGDGLGRIAGERLAADPEYQGRLRQGDAAPLKGAEIFAAYESGDSLAAGVIEAAVEFWGMAAANLISTFNPEKIIFGGGVFGPAGTLLERITAEAKRWAQPIAFSQVSLELSSLGGDAGLIGAGRLALEAARGKSENSMENK